MKFSLAVILLAFSPLLANASVPESCARIDSDTERLACYDDIFRETISAEETQDTPENALDRRLAMEVHEQHRWYSITPHKPNYFLPFTYNPSSDFSDFGEFGELFSDVEAKFQLSLKALFWEDLWRGSSIWGAYTQQSYWQIYADPDASAPFRETNHQPELIWALPVDFSFFGLKASRANFAFNHQSNGQSDPLSRSWNRLTAELEFGRGDFAFSAKTWVRIDDPTNDNNPNIEDYMGRLQLGAIYRRGDHVFDAWLINNLSSDNRSGLEVNWAFPLFKHVGGFVQFYTGYGENLIDMENYNNRIGIGIALTEWL